MNGVRRSDGLLAQAGFVELLAITGREPQAAAVVASAVAIGGFGSVGRAHNSLLILEEMGVVETVDGKVRQKGEGFAAGPPYDAVRRRIAEHYCGLLRSGSSVAGFQQDVSNSVLQVDRLLLPHRDICLPYLLLEFGVFVRGEGRAWDVAEDLAPAFLEVLASFNTKRLRAKLLTPTQLQAWLEARTRAGQLAEAFALSFERRRLEGHRLLDQVRWVAEEDVGLGFDIASFADLRSVLLDRFIEVKGHAGDRAFHWSQGEIEAARTKRQAYWLYLVDRTRLDDDGYEPEMVNDPYTYFIEENPAGWLAEPTSYFFSPPKGRSHG
jgi:hypothetical protein